MFKQLDKLPKLDVSLVLDSPMEELYEPLEQASLKHVTHKCAFLSAFTATKWIRDPQVSAGRFHRKEYWSVASFDLALNLQAKNQIPVETRNKLLAFLVPELGREASKPNYQFLRPIGGLRICHRAWRMG